MNLASVNWFVILIAVAANMLLGYLWYGPFFGKRWRKALGKKEEDIPTGSNRYIYLFFSSFLSALVLWHILPVSPFSRAMTVIWLWLSFGYFPYLFNSALSGSNAKTWLIETTHHVVGVNLTLFIIVFATDI